MLNLSPTNGEGNGDSPDIILESPSEDDDIDISQFVESILEEPEDPQPSRSPPPMVYFPNQTARKSHQVFRGGVQVPLLSQSSVPVFALASGIRPVQTVTLPVQVAVPPLHHVYPGKTLLVSNEGPSFVANNELPSITWLKDCFEKVKTSSATFTAQVRCLEDRLRCITSTSDTKKITSFSNDLQSLLKQSELGYKYLGTKLSSDHQAWALKASQRRLTLNMAFNGNQEPVARRQVLLPISGANNTITLRPNERLTLPPNMIISVNGNNHSLSIATADQAMDERRTAELCAQYGIKPCYVLLERCDTPEDGDTDNDDIEIIEELIAL